MLVESDRGNIGTARFGLSQFDRAVELRLDRVECRLVVCCRVYGEQPQISSRRAPTSKNVQEVEYSVYICVLYESGERKKRNPTASSNVGIGGRVKFGVS